MSIKKAGMVNGYSGFNCMVSAEAYEETGDFRQRKTVGLA